MIRIDWRQHHFLPIFWLWSPKWPLFDPITPNFFYRLSYLYIWGTFCANLKEIHRLYLFLLSKTLQKLWFYSTFLNKNAKKSTLTNYSVSFFLTQLPLYIFTFLKSALKKESVSWFLEKSIDKTNNARNTLSQREYTNLIVYFWEIIWKN